MSVRFTTRGLIVAAVVAILIVFALYRLAIWQGFSWSVSL
jgi:hypothetical protein